MGDPVAETLSPAPSREPVGMPGCVRPAGVSYSAAVHNVYVVSLLLGERVPHTAFALGSALCPGRTGFLPGLSYRHLGGLAPPGTVQGSAQAPSVLPEG